MDTFKLFLQSLSIDEILSLKARNMLNQYHFPKVTKQVLDEKRLFQDVFFSDDQLRLYNQLGNAVSLYGKYFIIA